MRAPWCLFFFLWLGLLPQLLLATVAYRSPDREFSLRLPTDWRLAFDPEEPFPVILGPADDIDGPNVFVTAYPTQLDLMIFAAESMKDFADSDTYQMERQDSFLTASRRRGVKMVAHAKSSRTIYTQVFYFVEGRKGSHYVFLATLPRARLFRYEAQLDNAMKTLCHTGEDPLWTDYLKVSSPEAARAPTPIPSQKTKPAPTPKTTTETLRQNNATQTAVPAAEKPAPRPRKFRR